MEYKEIYSIDYHSTTINHVCDFNNDFFFKSNIFMDLTIMID